MALAVSLLAMPWLVACVTPAASPALPPGDLAARVDARDATLAAFDRFRVLGGLGIWDDERSVTARVDWRQRGEALELGLSGPFGIGAARLLAEPGRASLQRGAAAPITGDSGGDVLQRALGLSVPIPLGQLSLWLRGLPGAASEVRRDARGRLETLRWRDASGTSWRARVRRYTTLDELELPSLLSASGGGYRLRLTLRDWSAERASETSPAVPAEPTRTPSMPARLPVPRR